MKPIEKREPFSILKVGQLSRGTRRRSRHSSRISGKEYDEKLPTSGSPMTIATGSLFSIGVTFQLRRLFLTLAQSTQHFSLRFLTDLGIHRLPPEVGNILLRQRPVFGNQNRESMRRGNVIVVGQQKNEGNRERPGSHDPTSSLRRSGSFPVSMDSCCELDAKQSRALLKLSQGKEIPSGTFVVYPSPIKGWD